jgi:hypothetical protein
VTEFGPVTRQMMLYRRATPRFVSPMTRPGPQLLDRLMGAVATRHRATRRRFLYGLAASVAIAAAGPGVMMLAAGGDHNAVQIAATDAKTGVWARITTADEDMGSDVRLEVKDAAGPRSCRLIAVGDDGSEQTVTSWTVPSHDARPITMRGSTAMHTDEIVRYEVRTAQGQHLVTLNPR